MLQAQNIRLFLRLSLFLCICCGLLAEAELKGVTERIVRSSEDLNNNMQSEVYISTLNLTLVKLETEISRLKEINEEKAEIKQLKSDLNDLQLKYLEVQNNLTECQKSKVKTTVFIKGLREQMLEDLNSGDWSKSMELMKRHLDQSTPAYEQLNHISWLNRDFPLKAAERGYIDLIEVMLDNKLLINKGYIISITMLHYAAYYGHNKLVKFLIERGADVNVRDSENRSPLHCAAMRYYVNIVQLLIENRADINATDDFGNTPLHWASQKCDMKIVKLLVEKGADIDATDNRGRTPLQLLATRRDCNSVVKYLENIRFNTTTASDKWDNTAADISTTENIL